MALQTSRNRRNSFKQGQRPLAGIAAFLLVLVKLLDGRLEVVAADEPHGVEGAAVVVGAQAVDRHDAGVLEPAGDLGLDDEAGALVLVERQCRCLIRLSATMRCNCWSRAT